jgi:hypothetical protein
MQSAFPCDFIIQF